MPLAAETAFQQIPLPTVKDENFRFTSLRGISIDRRPLSVERPGVLPSEFCRVDDEVSPLIAVRSGTTDPTRLALTRELEDLGVTFTDLRDAMERDPSIFSPHIEMPEIFANDPFARMVESRWQNGIAVHIPKGIHLNTVLRGIHWFDEASDVFFHRTVIIAEEGSELTYVDEFAGSGLGPATDAAPLALGTVQIIAHPGAKIRYNQIQNWSTKTQHFLRESVKVETAASVHQVTVALGGSKGQTRIESDCRGHGASIRHFGAVRADGDQHFDFWIRQLHSVPNTDGLMDFRGVTTDRSRIVFNAMIDIPQQALHTDATQKFKGLALSNKSTIDASPKLEIATHEVKCSHGVTVSTVDPDQIYYLTSRGIPRNEAEWMIINGFTQPIVQELPTEALRTRFHALMEQKHGATP